MSNIIIQNFATRKSIIILSYPLDNSRELKRISQRWKKTGELDHHHLIVKKDTQ